jgi:hypothetical protein
MSEKLVYICAIMSKTRLKICAKLDAIYNAVAILNKIRIKFFLSILIRRLNNSSKQLEGLQIKYRSF